MILHDINDKMKLLHTLRKYFLDSFILYPPLYHQINVRVSCLSQNGAKYGFPCMQQEQPEIVLRLELKA